MSNQRRGKKAWEERERLRETDLLLETASSSITNLAFPSTAGPSSGSMADFKAERLLENVSHSITNLTFPPMLVLLQVA